MDFVAADNFYGIFCCSSMVSEVATINDYACFGWFPNFWLVS